jgi:hypothetical protein
MTNNHVHPSLQQVKVGDRGGDEYDSMTCAGYYVSERPSPNMPSVSHRVWWQHNIQQWVMAHPTDPKGDYIAVPESLTIHPYFE